MAFKSPAQNRFFHSKGLKQPSTPMAPKAPKLPQAPKMPVVGPDNDDLPATGKYFESLKKKLRM
jgi:hypothetical protein